MMAQRTSLAALLASEPQRPPTTSSETERDSPRQHHHFVSAYPPDWTGAGHSKFNSIRLKRLSRNWQPDQLHSFRDSSPPIEAALG